jgi:hypothetical protein
MGMEIGKVTLEDSVLVGIPSSQVTGRNIVRELESRRKRGMGVSVSLRIFKIYLFCLFRKMM